MALISQRTILKSLRYGKDRVGGGDSNQPYIKSPIPDNSKSLDRTGEIDFLLRGGTLTPSRSLQDASRLTKMFKDTKSPNGILFIAKQNLLSRTGVKTQASGIINEGIYLPTSTILQAGGNAFGSHFLKQGINPFRNTSPDNGIDSLFGLKDPLGLPVYTQTVKSSQSVKSNRLVQLANRKLGVSPNPLDLSSPSSPIIGLIGGIVNSVSNIILTSPQISTSSNEILKYGGGPGSILGVGKTIIKRYSYTDEGKTQAKTAAKESKSLYGKTPFINITPTQTSEKGIFTLRNSYQYSNTNDGLNFAKNPSFKNKYYTLDSKTIFDKTSSKDTINISDFRKDLLPQQDKNSSIRKNILSISPDYTRKNIEQRVNLGNPGKRNKNVSSYSDGLGEALDKITAYPLYKSDKANTEDTNDLVRFRIGIIDNNTPDQKVYIHFRAFLDAMDDNYTATWDSFKYMGRGENFYRYNGFTRTINLGWTVAAQSKEELIPMYKKLNYLASSLAPDYSAGGYMRGNLATLTVGGYLYEQPGIITNINYSVPQESPWEIGIDSKGEVDNSIKQLPHIIRVTGFQFIPIHTFVPRVQQNEYLENGELNPGKLFGKERYIALTDGIATNYRSPTPSEVTLSRPPLDSITLPSNLPGVNLNR
jgi:hypothetical protein